MKGSDVAMQIATAPSRPARSIARKTVGGARVATSEATMQGKKLAQE